MAKRTNELGVPYIEFLTELDMRVIKDEEYELLSPFVIDVEGSVVHIPEGFMTDTASVPRIPFIYAALGKRGDKAAVLHDYTYEKLLYDRKTCDKYFYEALLVSGVSRWRAKAMWVGVRIGGWTYYNKRLKAREKRNAN